MKLEIEKRSKKCPMCKGKGFLKIEQGTIEDLKKAVGLQEKD